MSPKVLAAVPADALAELVVAQQQAKEAGKEGKWAHAYARRRRQMDVVAAARTALVDIGIEPMIAAKGAIPGAVLGDMETQEQCGACGRRATSEPFCCEERQRLVSAGTGAAP